MKKFLALLPMLLAAFPAFAGSGIIVSCPACGYSSGEIVVGGGRMQFAIPFGHEAFYCASSKEFVGLSIFELPEWGVAMEEVAALPYADEDGLVDALAALTDEEKAAHPDWAFFLEWYGRSSWEHEEGSGEQYETFGGLREDLVGMAVQDGFGKPLRSKACEGALTPLGDYRAPEAVCPVCGDGPVEVHDSGLMWD